MQDADTEPFPSPSELNSMPAERFVSAVRPLFEGGEGFLRRLAEARPFATDHELIDAAHGLTDSLPDEERIELVDAHPRIGAGPDAASAMSRAEQGYEEDAADTGWVDEELANLNQLYEARFGFRYVVFVAGRPREAIIPLLEHALRNEREVELRRGVQDAIYIAGDRLNQLRGRVGDEDDEDDERRAEEEPR